MLLADTASNYEINSIRKERLEFQAHMIETINKIVRTQRLILSEFGREATPEELQKLRMPLEKVRKVLKISKEPVSLEKPVGDEEDSSLEI